MLDYEELSDNEINELVADKLGVYAGNVHGSETVVNVKDVESGGMFYMEVDYCNRPQDAWPVIVENKIGVHWNVYLWRAVSDDQRFNSISGNPLRAAMVVFLELHRAT